MKKWRKGGVALVAAAALCATLGVGTAFAAGTTEVGGDGANWTVPTYQISNTVWKDADGNVVDEGTEGATQYKVLTTWAEAWSTSGPDYLGVSNSAYFGNGGNGNAKVETYESAAKTTTVGVWATAANENANAYNWNMFYNLYCDTAEGISAGAEKSDWTSASTATNGGSDWATEAGVWCGFKYRPEVVWTNNNLSASQAEVYIEQIRKGEYSATATKDGQTYAPDPDSAGSYDPQFYITNDENYDPQIISPMNNSPYSFVVSGWELADAVEAVMANTASYQGLGNNEALDWKTVNELPRSNRYSETPSQCAMNIEKLAKGSVYYTLSKIADGTVDKKKVAYVVYPWDYQEQARGGGDPTIITTETEVVVGVYDYTENIGSGPMDGRVSWTSLAVDQLGADGSLEVQTAKTGGGSVSSSDESTTTYTLYIATADDLLDCDVVYCSPNVTATATEFQEWIEANASSETAAAKAADMSYLVTWPCITNGSNFTMEKLIYGTYGMDFIYPELFPSMQLSGFWCDEIYHLTGSSLASAMSWIYASATLPEGATLSNIPSQYNEETVRAKLANGLEYYENSLTSDGSTDPTINRVLNNIGLDGTDETNGSPNEFNAFEPTDNWISDTNDVPVFFDDVPDSTAWYYEAVLYAAESGLIIGYDDSNNFGVGDSLTRAQLATILWRYSEPEEAAAYDASTAVNETGMADVEDGQYYTGAANWAVENGVINGFDNADGPRTFEPELAVTFEQMLTILANLSSEGANQTYPTTSLINFSDGDEVSDWAKPSVAWCADYGFFSGYDDGNGVRTIVPLEDVARERCATVIYNAVLEALL